MSGYKSRYTGAQIDAGIQAARETLPSQLAQIGSKLGDLTELETTDKSSAVAAINEVRDDVNSKSGQYEKSNEFVKAVLDINRNIIYGVKTNGDFYFGCGIPSQIKNALETLSNEHDVEIAEINSSINALRDDVDEANSKMGEYVSDDYWANVITDSEGAILEGILKNGTKKFNLPVEIMRGARLEHIQSPEWAKIVTDKNGAILYGVKTDGTVFINKLAGFENKIKKEVESIIDTNPVSIWSGKTIAWYGTSIPFGADNPLPIIGHPIKAYLRFNVMREYSKIDYLPAAYPIIASSLVGAKYCFNMAQGSSRLVRRTSSPSLVIRCLSLGNTTLENIGYIFGSYNIDVTNKTFSRNTSNTIGITSFLDGFETNWTVFCNEVLLLISQSYEIRLLANFLISDDKHTAFVQSILGEYYDEVNTMLTDVGMTMDSFVGHKGDVDLFVIEHSVNDTIDTSVPIDSSDVSTFAGAMNRLIDTIRFYKPSVRIAIVANYMDYPTALGVSSYMERIAKRLALPFANMADVSGVSSVVQTTCGYWDSRGYWHDKGFEWEENSSEDTYTTNCTFPSDIRSSSLAAMKSLVNPHMVDGVWCWESSLLYQWCADGLHPHTDKTGRLIILLGRMLASFIEKIGKSN